MWTVDVNGPHGVAGKKRTPLVDRVRIGGFFAVVLIAVIGYYLGQHKAQPSQQESAGGTQPHQDLSTAKPPVKAESTPSVPSPPPKPAKLSPGDISAKYSDAVVILESYNDEGQKLGQGSGFILSPRGQVLTNYHVIRGASRMQARMHDQSVHEVEYIAGFDMQHDVAALKIAGDGLPSIPIGSASTVKTGDHVTALGAPLGLENTLSDGIVSAVREAGNFRILQTTAPISHGSSGGPLFDDYGNVVALAVATIQAGENLNFAVPVDSAKALLASGRQTSFADLLSITAVRQPIFASSFSVPPRQAMSLEVAVPQQGGSLAGSFSIAGGLGNDISVRLVSGSGGVLWNGGVIKSGGNLSIRLPGGRYKLVFDNRMSTITTKTVSGSVELSYYR